MDPPLLEELIKQTDQLSPADRLLLASHLIESVRQAMPAEARRGGLKWRDIRGMAKPSMFGEDAQAYITRARHEDTQHCDEMQEQM